MDHMRSPAKSSHHRRERAATYRLLVAGEASDRWGGGKKPQGLVCFGLVWVFVVDWFYGLADVWERFCITLTPFDGHGWCVCGLLMVVG